MIIAYFNSNSDLRSREDRVSEARALTVDGRIRRVGGDPRRRFVGRSPDAFILSKRKAAVSFHLYSLRVPLFASFSTCFLHERNVKRVLDSTRRDSVPSSLPNFAAKTAATGIGPEARASSTSCPLSSNSAPTHSRKLHTVNGHVPRARITTTQRPRHHRERSASPWPARKRWRVTRRAEPSHPERDWLNGPAPAPEVSPEASPLSPSPLLQRDRMSNVFLRGAHASVPTPGAVASHAPFLYFLSPPPPLTLRGMFALCSSPLSLSSSFFFFFFFIRFIFCRDTCSAGQLTD